MLSKAKAEMEVQAMKDEVRRNAYLLDGSLHKVL